MSKILNSSEYIAYPWPEYQEFMAEDWFREESYYCADKDTYFIPKNRVKKSFNVYKIIPNIVYAGGCALIAANSIEEAIKMFCSDDYKRYSYESNICSCGIVYGMNYDTDKPCIIFDTIFVE